MPRIRLLASALLLPLFATPATAQDADPLPLPRLEGPVELDGLSDEPAWEAIPPLPLVTLEPTFGAVPSEATEIRMAYDDDYIYASLRAYDSDPSGIRLNTLYRDRYSGDDLFVVFLDTFNDNETGVTFTINPAGMRRDGAISNDSNTPNSLNADYNTFWDTRTTISDQGWVAEVRIPFSSSRKKPRSSSIPPSGPVSIFAIQPLNPSG